MEKYKATANNNENINNEVENSQDKKENLKNEAEDKATKIVGDVALNFIPGGKAISAARKLPVVGGAVDKAWNGAVKHTLKNMGNNGIPNPVNKITGQKQNTFGQSDKKEDNKNSGGNAKSNNSLFNKFGNSASKLKSSDLINKGDLLSMIPKPLKIKIIIGCSIAFFFMMMVFVVFAGDDIHNLELMNGDSTGNNIVSGNSSNLSSALQKVGQFYIDNVGIYSQGRDYVQIDFINNSFRKDCTGFAIAYMSYVAGNVLPDSYTLDMIDPNGNWSKTVAQYGWKAYTSDEIGSLDNLQMGDVLIADDRYGYSTVGQHAEIYIDSNHTFGWGSAKSVYPSDNSITVSNLNGHVHFMDNGHDYITIYRYMNVNNNESIEDDNLED